LLREPLLDAVPARQCAFALVWLKQRAHKVIAVRCHAQHAVVGLAVCLSLHYLLLAGTAINCKCSEGCVDIHEAVPYIYAQREQRRETVTKQLCEVSTQTYVASNLL
jgi:hypothetical protein